MTDEQSDSPLLAWEASQPAAITGDPLWKLNCYREALFLVELAGADADALCDPLSRPRGRDQLLTSVGSIAANIAEGYGRPTTGDRIQFFSYALGSAREAITWYLSFRSVDSDARLEDRLDRLARIRRMLLGLLTRLRGATKKRLDKW